MSFVYEHQLEPNIPRNSFPAGSAWERVEIDPGFSANKLTLRQASVTPIPTADATIPIIPATTLLPSSTLMPAAGEHQELQLVHAVARLKKDMAYFTKMGRVGDKLQKTGDRFLTYRTSIQQKLAEVRFEQQTQAMFLSDFLMIDSQLRENVERWNRSLRHMVVYPAQTSMREAFNTIDNTKTRFLGDHDGVGKALKRLSKANLKNLDREVPSTAAAIQKYRESRNLFAVKHRELEAEKYRLFDENVRRLVSVQHHNMRESLAQIRTIQSKMQPSLYQAQAQQLQALREIQPRTTADSLLKQRQFAIAQQQQALDMIDQLQQQQGGAFVPSQQLQQQPSFSQSTTVGGYTAVPISSFGNVSIPQAPTVTTATDGYVATVPAQKDQPLLGKVSSEGTWYPVQSGFTVNRVPMMAAS